MHAELVNLSWERLPLPLIGRTFSPVGWDSPSFATNLTGAMAGAQHGPNSSAITQAMAYKRIIKKVSDGWADLLLSKVVDTFAIEVQDPSIFLALSSERRQLAQVLKSASSAQCTACLKTWVNSWSTSCRYHEADSWPCVFGCAGEKDDLSHYLTCDPLWSLACEAVPTGCRWQLPQPHPLEKLCFLNTSPAGIKRLAMVYRGYHAIRMSHRTLVERCIVSGDYTEIHLLFKMLCSNLWTHG